MVKFATRGANTVDLVLTNLQDLYDSPDRLPPFGLSDHISIQVRLKSRADLPKGRFVIKSRDLRPSKRLAMRTYLQEVNIPGFTNSVPTLKNLITKRMEALAQGNLQQFRLLRNKVIRERMA